MQQQRWCNQKMELHHGDSEHKVMMLASPIADCPFVVQSFLAQNFADFIAILATSEVPSRQYWRALSTSAAVEEA